MAKLGLTLVIRDYEYLAPLARGEVAAEGIDLKLELDTHGALTRALNDPSLRLGEISLGRYLQQLAERGACAFVGIPFFLARSFRHRAFFVRRNSDLRELKSLEGRNVGTDEWPATGNTWSRAALREQGVRLETIHWWVGTIDGTPGRPQGKLPAYVQVSPPGCTLREMLLEGKLDALMCPFPPRGFYEPESPIVRLIPDFRQAEQEYYRRTGIYPAHHIVGIRRDVFERDPWVARSLYEALEQSKNVWLEVRRQVPEAPPWLLAEIEETMALMGRDWRPSGIEANRLMIQALCDELFAQDLIARTLDGPGAFAEFKRAMEV